MDKKVKKCDWDTCSAVRPSLFKFRDSDLALGAAEGAENMWLAGDKVGRDISELWFVEKSPWADLRTKVNFCSSSCHMPREVTYYPSQTCGIPLLLVVLVFL